ncbi:MAG: 1-phosphofructokinase family hexose kinase, partial [Bacteroidota bacterium]
MITTVTLNAAIDKTYTVPGLTLGRPQRVQQVLCRPGGKGINVARVAAALGAEVVATGFIGGGAGRWIREELTRLGLANEFVSVEGESRTTLALVDPVQGSLTELREPGPEISPGEARLMVETVRNLAGRSRVVVLSGSLPGGVPGNFYRELVGVVKEAGALALLDTSGPALVQGLEAHPFMIKPNEEELRDLGNEPVPGVPEGADPVRAVQSARRWVERGISLVVVSLGAAGLVAATRQGAWAVRPPSVAAVNTVGCGDALVAGCTVVFDRHA